MDPRLWNQLERVESEVKAKEVERRAAVDTKLTANIDQEIQLLVDEKRDVRQQLSAMQAQLAGPAGAVRCPLRGKFFPRPAARLLVTSGALGTLLEPFDCASVPACGIFCGAA